MILYGLYKISNCTSRYCGQFGVKINEPVVGDSAAITLEDINNAFKLSALFNGTKSCGCKYEVREL